MTIPTGQFTSEQVRSEWGFALPFTSAQVASAAGLAAPWTSDQLRGKSARSISIGIMDFRLIGRGNSYHDQITFGIHITGGGTPTSYEWSGDVWGSNSTVVFSGPGYDPMGYTTQNQGFIQCSVVIAGQTYYASTTFTYTAGDAV